MEEIKGNIHSIESMSVLDGPGIRYVVFMQGCNLKCKFCHNIDTTQIKENMLFTPEVLVKRIINVKEYFDFSKGGVTFSGGEPLLQTRFLIKVCKMLKKENIHIAIDTAGNFEITNEIRELLKYVDLVLLDIKHIDNEKHKYMTGVSNDKILKFAKYLSDNNIKTWIRIVYMPGFTDEKKEELKEFIHTLNNVEKIDVLPYHDMGVFKWKKLGLEYELNDMKIPTKEETDNFLKYICTQ